MRTSITLLFAFALFGTSVFSETAKPRESGEIAILRAKAESGNADAQNDLGWMLDTGDGVPEDDAEAVKWYRKAAEQNHAVAQCNLGYAYANGEGVGKDSEAVGLGLGVVARQGCQSAKDILSRFLLETK